MQSVQLIQVLHLGTVDYGAALRLQQTLAELRKQRRIADTLLLLEHPPVITLGRNSKTANVIASKQILAERGVETFEINRGGDVTFHGPGQLVGYPICDLRGFAPKIGAVDFVRRLEETLVRALAEFGIDTQRVEKLTGVWTRPAQEGGEQRKIAAIGVHISRGVTSHGFALNVETDLESFKLIVPCGIADKPVTSMQQELGGMVTSGGKKVDMETVSQAITRQFGNVFGVQVLWLESLEDLLRSAEPEDEDGPQPANQDTPLREEEELKKMREELEKAPREDVHWA